MAPHKGITRKLDNCRNLQSSNVSNNNDGKSLVLNDLNQSSLCSISTDTLKINETNSITSKDFNDNVHTVDIKTAAIIISIFSGSNDSLEDFCRACQEAYESVTDKNKIFMLKVIRSKCTGEARKYLRGKANKYKTLEAFLKDLKNGFGLRDNYNSLSTELSSITQNEGETIRQYGIRVNDVLARLVDTIRTSYSDDTAPGTEAGARDNAVNCFIEGLNHDSVADRVRSTKPNSLEEALNTALEIEKSQDWRDYLHSKCEKFRTPISVALVDELSSDSVIKCFVCHVA